MGMFDKNFRTAIFRLPKKPVKLESHVVSLQLAKELKEAGYPQESLFSWYQRFGKLGNEKWGIVDSFYPEYVELLRKVDDEYGTNDRSICAAPIASEIELLMPKFGDGSDLSIDIYADTTGYEFSVVKEIKSRCGTEDETLKYVSTKTLVDGYAQCWLYLKSNNLLNQ